jgi:hypothetical protein
MLDIAKRERLCKLCGLLGSNHVGERAAAALKANDFLHDHGLTWREVISLPQHKSEPETLAELCGWLLGHPETLNEWELDFVTTISSLDAISPKQRDQLDRITAKVRAYRAAGGAA